MTNFLCAIEIFTKEEYVSTLEQLFANDIYWLVSGKTLMLNYFQQHENKKLVNLKGQFYLLIENPFRRQNNLIEYLSTAINPGEKSYMPKKVYQLNKLNEAIAYISAKKLPNEKVTEF